ncbi:MAG: zinc-ribbon domain containing protein [Vicinamibacterales bacterium]
MQEQDDDRREPLEEAERGLSEYLAEPSAAAASGNARGLWLDDRRRHRVCRVCAQPFEISNEELVFLQGVALRRQGRDWYLPRTCTPCRMFARRERFAAVDDGRDSSLICVACGEPFIFEAGEKRYYAERGYARPRRCHQCRHRTGRR